MSRRCLYGPVADSSAWRDLPRREAGACLTFHPTDDADLRLHNEDSWEAITAALPPGWRPDFVLLELPHDAVAPGIWSAPVPLVALADDWETAWEYYRRCLPRCDLILTDPRGRTLLEREGVAHVESLV